MRRRGTTRQHRPRRLLVVLTLGAVGVILLEPLASGVLPLLMFAVVMVILIGTLRRS